SGFHMMVTSPLEYLLIIVARSQRGGSQRRSLDHRGPRNQQPHYRRSARCSAPAPSPRPVWRSLPRYDAGAHPEDRRPAVAAMIARRNQGSGGAGAAGFVLITSPSTTSW